MPTLKISEVGDAEVHITSLFDRLSNPKAKSPFGVKFPHEGTKTHDRVVGIAANSTNRADFAYVGVS